MDEGWPFERLFFEWEFVLQDDSIFMAEGYETIFGYAGRFHLGDLQSHTHSADLDKVQTSFAEFLNKSRTVFAVSSLNHYFRMNFIFFKRNCIHYVNYLPVNKIHEYCTKNHYGDN